MTSRHNRIILIDLPPIWIIRRFYYRFEDTMIVQLEFSSEEQCALFSIVFFRDIDYYQSENLIKKETVLVIIT